MTKGKVKLENCPFCGELAVRKVVNDYWSRFITTGFGWAVIVMSVVVLGRLKKRGLPLLMRGMRRLG